MLVVHPYFTSSIYTASVVVNYTKILEGAPPIQILISPLSPSLIADEVGFVTNTNYAAANTTIQVKEGDDFLRFTTQSTAPVWRAIDCSVRARSQAAARPAHLAGHERAAALLGPPRRVVQLAIQPGGRFAAQPCRAASGPLRHVRERRFGGMRRRAGTRRIGPIGTG